MGKLIPDDKATPEAVRAPLLTQPGPLQQLAGTLNERLKKAEEEFDLDELDRLARRHARLPATGSAEALEALAVVVRCAPELFFRSEVDLQPARLEGLADRERAMGVLEPAISRLCDLVKDSQLEQGDEVVELMNVGCSRAQKLDPARIFSNDRLSQAMDILSAYQRRVTDESAHQSAESAEKNNPPKKKKKA